MHRLFAIALAALPFFVTIARAADPPAGRIVFLGDSNTYGGHYIEYIDALLRLGSPQVHSELLDLGLPSETVSGLSEPNHAEGKFPRPALSERLARVLDKTRPALVVACYGMNDGIYYPPSPERLAKYQAGIRALREQATAAGAKLLLITPPVFDPVPIQGKTLPAGLTEYPKPYEGYDDVLEGYTQWLLAQRAQGWDVVDVHGPMKERLAEMRRTDPNFRFAGDGVHIDAAGHWIIAREILRHWNELGKAAEATSGDAAVAAYPKGTELLQLVAERQRLLKDAWLTAAGHKRPGMNPGLPLADAERKAGEIQQRIDELLATQAK